MTGIVFDIKRFAIHDGKGIRTTLFTKGCPLNCPWCQNPEGREKSISLWYFQNKCIGCNICIKKCPEGALELGSSNNILINNEKCTKCGMCTQECPAKAIAFDGREMTVDEVIRELLKDKDVYDISGGGITISGGDPLAQHEFNIAILKKCKENGIHTAIETCLYAPSWVLKEFIKVTDLFITDLKIMDNQKHGDIVGTDNTIIKKNFEMLAQENVEILLRIPLIPGYTNNKENLKSISEYVAKIRKDIPAELVNFNPLAESKYRAMKKKYIFHKDIMPFSEKDLDNYKRILKNNGLKNVL